MLHNQFVLLSFNRNKINQHSDKKKYLFTEEGSFKKCINLHYNAYTNKDICRWCIKETDRQLLYAFNLLLRMAVFNDATNR